MTWVPIYKGQEDCTGADGSGISNRAPTTAAGYTVSPGYGPWENGTGLFALGASIQGNKIQRTAAGGGTQIQHNMLHASGFIRDEVNHCVDISRPADAANQQRGFFCRGNGNQFSGVANDGIYLFYDRIDATHVAIKMLEQVAGAQVQAVTCEASFALAVGEEFCLGVTLNAGVIQVWRAPKLADRDQMAPSPDERVNCGAPITLTNALNDNNHRFTGAWGRTGTTGGTWDNFNTWTDRDISAPARVVVR